MQQLTDDGLRLKTWTEGFDIELTVGRLFLEARRDELAYVACRGRYLQPGLGEASRPIRMAIRAALAWESNRPTAGLVVDFSALAYERGDRLLAWRFDREIVKTISDRVGLVMSDQNAKSIRSLLLDEDDEGMVSRCHMSIAAAVHEILGRAAGPQ